MIALNNPVSPVAVLGSYITRVPYRYFICVPTFPTFNSGRGFVVNNYQLPPPSVERTPTRPRRPGYAPDSCLDRVLPFTAYGPTVALVLLPGSSPVLRCLPFGYCRVTCQLLPFGASIQRIGSRACTCPVHRCVYLCFARSAAPCAVALVWTAGIAAVPAPVRSSATVCLPRGRTTITDSIPGSLTGHGITIRFTLPLELGSSPLVMPVCL